MYAVGRVGTYIAQSVYTVSGPFHPFGGAVDIIVVQQEDGTFKSSPWYVKFGKFQGVLKRREKKVDVSVNDGESRFHMYLDHKGEAYFLKDAQGDDGDSAFYSTEAASSGDESSSHMLALEYPRGEEEGASARAEQGKEESEEEADLELRFEGREASKQLIKKAVEERETAALPRDESNVAEGNHTGDLEIRESSGDSRRETLYSRTETSGAVCESNSSNGKVMHALLNKAISLETAQRSTPAGALLANATNVALKSSSGLDDFPPREASTKVRKTASSNGMIVHGLLNQAVGLQPSHRSGPAIALVATAALASLRRAVSDPQSESSSNTPDFQPKLVELAEGDLYAEKNHEYTVSGNPGGERDGERKESVPVQYSVSNSSPIGSLTSNGNSSHGVGLMKTLGSLSAPESDADEPEGQGQFLFESASIIGNSLDADVVKRLEVRKVEVLHETLVVEVLEHAEITGLSGSEDQKDIPSDTEARVESFVVDRKLIMEKALDLREPSGQDESGKEIEQKLEAVHEQDVTPEEAGDQNVNVHVDKLLLENLNDALSQDHVEGPQVILAGEETSTSSGKEVAPVSAEDAKDVRSPEVRTAGEELVTSHKEVALVNLEDAKDVRTPEVKTAAKEIALLSPGNLTDVSSPRLKAAIELEMAWREVMEKAATTLKGAPYASKKLSHNQSYKKKGPANSESGQIKKDGLGALPEQSERKTWGGWFWGAGTTPQPKQTGGQSSSKDQKTVQRESSMEPRALDLPNDEMRDQSGVVSELDDVSKSGAHAEQGVILLEGSDSNVETEGKGAQSESDSGQTEGQKAGADNWVLRGKPEDQSELISDNKAQQKVQGGPPARKRSLFGLLSRSNTNQSSLSSASSLQSNDDLQPPFDDLNRETSLERAESVVDLLEAKWARGSDMHKGLMAIARVPDDRITKQPGNSEVEGETLGIKNAEAASKQVEGINMLLAVKVPEDRMKDNGSTDGPDTYLSGPETVIAQVVGELDENSVAFSPKCDQVTTTVRKAEADAENTGGHQPEMNVMGNGLDLENTSIPLVSDRGPGEISSNLNTDLMVMSVGGHLLTAPLLLEEDAAPRASPKLHENICDEGVETKRVAGSSPSRNVCFAGNPEGRPGSSSVTNHLPRNGLQQMHQAMGVGRSEQSWQDLDRHVSPDPIAGPRLKGLKDLARLVEFDNVRASQPKMGCSFAHEPDRFASESGRDEVGPTAESEAATGMNGDDQGTKNSKDTKQFEDMRAMVFEKLEESEDADAQVLNQGELERYYPSQDLREGDDNGERRGFKRNTSVYMDAISGEDEQEGAESAHEDALDQSRDKSSPIGIPGTHERASNFPSSNDMHLLRSASESLPNARDHMVNSEMASPGLILSRSLDSSLLPNILPTDMREQIGSSDSVVTTGPSTSSPVKDLEKEAEGVIAAERLTGKVKGESEELSEGISLPSTQSSTSAASSTMDDRGKGPETGFELSLCRHLLTERMGLEAAACVFAAEKVTLDDFKRSGSAVASNEKLVVRVGGRYYPWVVAAPIVLGILAFGQVLIAPNEGAIAVEQPIVVFDGKAATHTLSTVSSGGWKLWPFGGMRRPKTPEKGNTAALVSRDALIVATEAALKSSLTKEYLRMAGYYKRPRKVRTNSPSSQQLASLNLKEGSNKITFTFVTRMLGKQQVDARIYLWKWNTRIVISDVDGTITKSDVLGQVMPLVGKDWTQSGVARLFSAIKKNGYELMFLSARAISQAYLTRQFLENIKQDGEVLPDGPVVISPDGLFPSLYREVIRRAPHEFKIACLEDIKSLFPPESKPFYAGFGNRDTDELSYLKVGISKGKIFIINPKGEVAVNNQVDVKSYTSLHKLVDDMFPAMTFTEQEDYNEWNFWKLPLPDIEDELSVKSASSSTSRRGVKSSRHS